MSEPDIQLPEQPNCLNCGTRLQGQYCGQCGQRATSRLISLWELTRDAFGDLFELDSRLWRTLVPLLAQPGKLTRDYLEGRRARYMPPFRMYLVLSVIFFVVAFFDPRDDLSLLFEPEPEPEPTPEQVEDVDEKLKDAAARIDELEAAGRLTEEQAKTARAAIDDSDDDENSFTFFGDDTDGGFNVRYDEETGKCVASGADQLPRWMQRRLTQERLEEICERVAADEGKTLTSLLLDNIPVALIVLLPVMALVLKGLYPLSRRYFVEHLLFFVHFHSFFFLILALEIIFSRLAGLIFVPKPLAVLVVVAASLYIPVYLYKAMRRVYGQGHIFTLIKYVALVVAYAIGALFTMAGAFLFALISV